MPREQASDFYTVAEAANILGVSVSTVWRWIDSHRLAAFRLGPKAIRIKKQDVEAAIQPVAQRKGVTMMNSIFADLEIAARPLTRDERERGLSAVAAAAELRHRIRVRRKGKALPDSAALIRAAREERSRRI